jgi:hypothetical protein
MKYTNRILALALLATAVGAGEALAATQGTLGSTSTGTSLISLTIPTLYKITDVADIALGTYSGSGTMSGNDDLCVYSTGSTSYHVQMTDDATNTPANFAVDNAGHTVSIPMAVKWNSTTGTAGNSAVTYNTAFAGTNANTSAADCSVGGKSANVQVNFIQADLQAAPAAPYSTTLTMIIEP